MRQAQQCSGNNTSSINEEDDNEDGRKGDDCLGGEVGEDVEYGEDVEGSD